MPYFIVKGVGKESKKRRSKKYKAQDENHARVLAEKDGTSVEIILEDKPSLATESQIKYAKDLNLSFPSDININEMNNVINKKVENDLDAPIWLQEFALSFFPEELGLAITKYIGVSKLIEFIIYRFIETGNIVGLIKLLIYTILNHETKSNWRVPFNEMINPSDVEEIAEILSRDQRMINSIKRYQRSDLVFLDEETDPNVYVSSGGIKGTNAYKITKELLIDRKLIKSPKQGSITKNLSKNNIDKSAKTNSSKNKGCLGSIVLSVIIILSIIGSFKLL
jgi:hypothetical protein